MRLLGFSIGFTFILAITMIMLGRHEVLIPRLSGSDPVSDSQPGSIAAEEAPLTDLETDADGSRSTRRDTKSESETAGPAESRPQTSSDLLPIPDISELPPMPSPENEIPDTPAASSRNLPIPERVPVVPTQSAYEHTDGAQTKSSTESADRGKDELSVSEMEWQPFWTPFNTRSSAQGFADVIAAKTQLPIRVVETRPGVYRPAFSYTADDERQTIKRLIESRTGLSINVQ